MPDTQTRPSPATFAALLAAKKAKPPAPIATTVTSRPKPAPPKPRNSRPYTTQSDGYEVPRSLPALPVVKAAPTDVLVKIDIDPLDPEVADLEPDREPEAAYTESWMPNLGAFDIDRTPRLKRTTIIDPLDPTEELDATPEFWGFSVVAW